MNAIVYPVMPDRKGIVRGSRMSVAIQPHTALQAGGGQGEPDPGSQKPHCLYPQVSLHPIVAQHFFMILISSVFSRPVFGSVTPGWDFLPASLTGECPQPGLTPPGKFQGAEKVQGAVLSHCPPPPCFLSHVTTSPFPVHQSQKISAVRATALKMPCEYSAKS